MQDILKNKSNLVSAEVTNVNSAVQEIASSEEQISTFDIRDPAKPEDSKPMGSTNLSIKQNEATTPY